MVTVFITCNEVINVLCIDFVLFSLLLVLFRGDTFSSLKSTIKQGHNLLPSWLFIVRKVRYWLTSLCVYDRHFDNDLLLICKHPPFYSELAIGRIGSDFPLGPIRPKLSRS